jgi:hypothetical protein
LAARASPFKHLPSRTVGRRAPNLAGAIYGTLVAIAVVAGLGESTSVSTARAFWILVASGLFFWAAHVYAYLLSDRIHGHVPTTRADVQRIVFREWPLFQSTFPLAVPLALGWSGLIDGDTALVLATIVGVATLAAWGISFSRGEGYGLTGIIASASINAAVGLLIVALKVAVP